MPRSLLWPDPRVKPPFGAAEIDWGHELARGLVSLWLPGGGRMVHDLEHTKDGTIVAGGCAALLDGLGVPLNGTTQYINVGHVPSFNLTDSLSLVVRCRSTDATENAVIFNKNYDGANALPYSLCLGGSPSAGIYDGMAFYTGPWFKSGITVDVRGDGILHTIGGTFDRLNLRYWIDGRNDRTVSGSFPAMPTTTTDINVGHYPAGSVFFAGDIYHAGMYKISQSANNMLWLHYEPYAMLRPIIRRRYFVPAAAGVAYPRLERGRRGIERGILIGDSA